MSLDLASFIEKTYPKSAAVTSENATLGPTNAASWRQKLRGPARLDQLTPEGQRCYKRFIEPGINADILPAGLLDKRLRLAAGNDSDYGDDASGGDLAFAGMLAREKLGLGDIEIVMRARRYRPKFDEYRGSERYLEMTINKQKSPDIPTQTIASSAADIAEAFGASSRLVDDITEPFGASREPVRVPKLLPENGVLSLSDELPPKRDFVFDELVVGTPAVLASAGGVGKSMFAVMVAGDVATGGKLSGIPCTAGGVLMIMGEDDVPEINRRFNGTIKGLGQEAHREAIQKMVASHSMVGQDIRLTAMTGRTLETTPFADEIIAACKAHALRCGVPVRIIFIDHAGLFHGGDQNAKTDVALTMMQLGYIAKKTGAAVMFLAHTPKSSSASEISDANAVAGSTAWVDHARYASILAGMRSGEAKLYGIDDDDRWMYVSVATVKNNYGRQGRVRWYKRESVESHSVGILRPIVLLPLVKPVKAPKVGKSFTSASDALQNRILALVKEQPGAYSATKLRDGYGGTSGVLQASKADVLAALESMLADGRLTSRAPTGAERKTHKLTRQTTRIFDAPDA